MTPRSTRINADFDKIYELCRKSNGGIVVKSKTEDEIILEFNYRTIENSSGKMINKSVVKVQLPSKYPFAEPKVIFTTNIFHPNIYSSGQVCLGLKWVPTYTLDFLVERIANIIIFDQTILNLESPANTSAKNWYNKEISKNTNLFPTDKFVKHNQTKKKSTMKWTDVSKNKLANRNCPSCGVTLRLPVGKEGDVKCPKCNFKFKART